MGGVLLPRSSLLLSRSLFPSLPPPFSCSPSSLLLKIHGASHSRIIRRCVLYGKSPMFCSIAQSSSSSRYGGWDDLLLGDGSETSGVMEKSRGVLVAMGIADVKSAILFLLGFLSALAVSRVRVGNLAALAFAGSGFVWGLLIGVAGIRDSPSHKGRSEGELVEEFGAKLSELKIRLQGFLALNHRESGEREGFPGLIDSLDHAAAPARDIGQESAGDGVCIGVIAEDGEPAAKPNPKSNKKKREAAMVRADLVQLLATMFKETPIGRGGPKVKGESVERLNSTNLQMEAGAKRQISNNEKDEERGDPWLEEQSEDENDESSERLSSGCSAGMSENPNSRTASTENGNGSCRPRDRNSVDVDEHHVLNGDLHLTSLQENQRKLNAQGNNRKTEGRTRQDRAQERPAEEHDARINGEAVKNMETQEIDFRQRAANSEDVERSSSSSSREKRSDEEEFDRIVKCGTGLLREAGECLTGRGDEQTAEILLYKSARLLSTAVAMKPMNPQALGQLGNACLLHGELKLKISRDLRTILSKNSPSFVGKSYSRPRSDEQSFLKKEKMVSALVDVCEECEELLFDAGRKYKMVLSIDETDVRALYNWGLALSFRAELIADTGPDAIIDADKIYLAAIEKFDAVLSRSSDCSSDALFRWGVALRRRSQLRPRGSNEKMKLLRQAKTLFEDVLRVEADNLQVRDALRSCISELRLR